MGGRINTIMQTCFFAISGVLPREEAIAQIKKAIEKTYGKKGAEVVQAQLRGGRRDARAPPRGRGAGAATGTIAMRPTVVPRRRPTSSSACTAVMLAGKGDLLPVSAFPVDGTWPTGTAQWEKRNIALEIPVWDAKICIQCNKCALVCPHAAIRAKVYDPAELAQGAGHLQVDRLQGRRVQGEEVHDPGGARGLHRLRPVREGLPGQGQGEPEAQGHRHGAAGRRCASAERDELRLLPRPARADARRSVKLDLKGSQFLQPLFEYSGACAGCGETPYIKLLTQLFGDRAAHRQRHRLLVDLRRQPADHALHARTATAAARPGRTRSSRTTPSSASACGSPSTQHTEQAVGLVNGLGRQARRRPGEGTPRGRPDGRGRHRRAARARASRSSRRSTKIPGAEARRLLLLADYLVKKSVWIVGGDGWAYDIGYGGLDHVLAMHARRQRPGPRHRGLLQHRRPGVEGDAARRRRQVRRRRARRSARRTSA